jgi:hypothetical protein
MISSSNIKVDITIEDKLLTIIPNALSRLNFKNKEFTSNKENK